MFKKDNKLAKGGRREGSGRKPDWFRAKCERIIESKKLLEFMADVAEGKCVERYVTEKGDVLDVPASIKDRIRAVEFLTDRAFGKATEKVEHSVNATLEQLLSKANE